MASSHVVVVVVPLDYHYITHIRVEINSNKVTGFCKVSSYRVVNCFLTCDARLARTCSSITGCEEEQEEEEEDRGLLGAGGLLGRPEVRE